ncbi:MAG: Glutamine cyclotransferase [Hydrocarboniphaga sp.]|nr:Glutamine cyclotransferase [Hydrocarboniphaga sp.]
MLSYRIVAEYPHDMQSFTEGLEISDGQLFESAGGYGESRIFVKDLRRGAITRQTPLPKSVFGEGLTVLRDQIFVLTWREGLGFVFDRGLKERRRFSLPREGWGLTHMPTLGGERLLMSDGSSKLYQLDPVSLKETGSISVTEAGSPVEHLNELEYARGEIYANVWMSPRIAVIQTGTGQVRAWVDFSKLPSLFEEAASWRAEEHVLNGIAFDESSGHFFITGKCWPKLFEIELSPR